jgi:glycosyltransferase involved in cell wall biosynthesis
LTPDEDSPSGGIQITYRHVDILNDANISAVILHQRKGFRCTWFSNTTRVTDISSSSIGPDDFLVVSGLDIDLITAMPRRVRHIILNQGAHVSWTRQADEVARHYAESTDLLGVVTVSEHSMQMLQYAYPKRAIHRVYNSIDSNLFHPPATPKPRRISYFPRRGYEEARQVFQLLHGRDVLRDWEIFPLDRLDQVDFAAGLRSSRITLNLSYQEGFGLPAAEAMACGSYVIGFHAFGGREFMRPEFSFPVETGDVLAVAEAVESVITADAHDDGWCRARGDRASTFVLGEYSRQRERESVKTAYSSLLGRAAGWSGNMTGPK